MTSSRAFLALAAGVLLSASGPSAGAQDILGIAPSHAPSPPPPAGAVLSLGQVLDSALTRYPAVLAARARVRAARGTRTTAGVVGNPMLAYQVENAAFPGRNAVPGMDRENMTTATLPLASLYQRGARVRQADAGVRAAEADARAERQRVALDAARAYYRAAVATVSADAAQNLAQWLDSVVAYNRTRVGQGAAAEADLIRSQLERDRATADAGMELAELARARADLSAFLGDPGNVSDDFTVALEETPLAMPSAEPRAASSVGGTVVAHAVSGAASAPDIVDRRPDVVAARERLAEARAGAAVEQRLIVRELGATLGLKQSAGVNSMIAGVSLPLPVFDQNRGAIARAGAERDAAAFELAGQERTARAEVRGAEAAARILTARSTALAARDSTGRGAAYLARADEARAITFGAYREGAVSLLQVLDAARAWGEARVAYYRSLYAQHEAVLALLVARGDDLVTALPTLTPAPPGAPTR